MLSNIVSGDAAPEREVCLPGFLSSAKLAVEGERRGIAEDCKYALFVGCGGNARLCKRRSVVVAMLGITQLLSSS